MTLREPLSRSVFPKPATTHVDVVQVEMGLTFPWLSTVAVLFRPLGKEPPPNGLMGARY